MRKLFLFLFVPLIFSCGGNSSEKAESVNILENLTFTVDTVMIDAGDEIIFLGMGLNFSSISPDKKLLFNFNPNTTQLEIIDLVNLKVREKISLDRDGPLGVGDPRKMYVDHNRRLFMIGLVEIRIFSPALDSMRLIKLSSENLKGLEGGESLGPEVRIISNGDKLLTTYGLGENFHEGLAIVSLENLEVRKIPFELGKKINPFVRTFYLEGKLMSRSIEKVFFFEVDGVPVASSEHFNEAYLVDLENDSIYLKRYNSKITRNEKSIPVKTEGQSFEEMEALYQESIKQVDFGGFYWDEERSKVWRFTNEFEREISDSLTYRQVVTIFDLKMNQIGEREIKIDPFTFKFFKDGKLWSYVNVEDELGFAVMDFKF